MLRLSLTALIGLLPYVSAQSALYGQCGGLNWTGPTTCVAGAVCTYSNPYYSQCLAVSSSSTVATSSSTVVTSTTVKPTTTSTATTVKSTTTSTTAPSSTPTTSGPANFIFSFGDSYTQTGFTPNGTLPNAANPLGNPDFPGWTATGGTNWLGYVIETYNKSEILTYNYAYGGATIDATLVVPYTSTVLSLTDQVNQFLTTVASKPATTPWTSANSLFTFWIGINDLGNSYYQSGDRSAFSDTLLAAYFALVQKLYNVGARNFLFVNVPPTDRSPLMLSQAATAQALLKSVIGTFNTKLVAQMSAFKANNTGVQTFLYDSNAQFTTILNSPTTYGFADSTSQGTASTNFWINDLHTTTYANKYFGQTVGQTVLANTIW